MNAKLKFLLKFPEIKEKNRLFGLYRGFVNCLDNQSALELLVNDETTGFKAEAIIKKIKYSAEAHPPKKNNLLIKKAINHNNGLKWPNSQRIAKVLFGISPYIANNEKSKLIRYFLNSKYNSFRYYGYEIIEKNNLKTKFKTDLVNVWHRYPDNWVLGLLIDFLTPKELFSMFEVAEEVLAESEYDFEILKLRNRYYSKIINFIPDRLRELMSEEPVSYVYVMKYANRKIPKDTAIKIYKNNKNNSVLSCYGELGQWDVLEKIFNKILPATR